MLRRLAPRQRAILYLTVVEGFNDREISQALGISASSVRVHRLRGRRRLEHLVGRESS
jgi:RNA polymerase sigma factor (sigma-70 family)